MKIIKVSNTLIHIHSGPIGISLSGGADSSVLLYILMSQNINPIHIFTCVSKQKNFTSALTSAKVINQCIKLTGNHHLLHRLHYVDQQTIENLFYEDQFRDINVLYTAITQNPPAEVTNTFSNIVTENERDTTKIKPLYSQDQKVYMPFANIDKKEIFNIYKELDLLNTLLPLTRSCESLTLTEGHCGECWWCEERSWAFDKL